jgi:hypothetical protein
MTPEKKNKLLAFSLAVLSLTIILILFISSDPLKDVEKDRFKIKDPDKVNQITLESPRGKIDLTFQPSGWIVNGKYPADANMIRVLFATLMQNEPRRPVAARLQDSLSHQLQAEGVHVTAMSEGIIVNNFFAGGNRQKTMAYFRSADDEQVYIMAIPGYRVYVSGVYELDEGGFRNKNVFAFNWKNFNKMEVTFPSQPSENFSVVLDKELFTIPELGKVDTTKLSTFLGEVYGLALDQFAKSDEYDTLSAPRPLMQISISDIAGRNYLLRVFKEKKNNLVLGQLGREFVFFQPERIQPVLRPKSFFRMK